MKLAVVFVAVLMLINLSEAFNQEHDTKIRGGSLLSRLRRRLIPPPKKDRDAKIALLNWLEQKLDHFRPTETRTWQQKYYSNTQWYTEGGPVFIMIGGEGPASPSWVLGGQMVEQAKLYHAAVFYLEHRFYGESHPLNDTSVESLQFLTSEQALADLSLLISHLRESAYPTGKLVVFGGSYAGNLAAWAKLRYPHLIDGAIASSAPVLAQVDFPEYQEVVANAMNASDPNCLSSVRQAVDAINAILEETDGPATITELFNLCTPYDPSNKQDVANFYSSFANIFDGVVQYAGSLADVRLQCDEVTNTRYGKTPLDRYIQLAKSYLAPPGGCFDHSYASFFDYFQDLDWDSDGSASGSRPWFYQTCTEYGYYQTSTSSIQPFGDFFKVDFYLQWCPDFYSSKFNEAFVYDAINNNNLLYGGIHPQLDNVVFVHGSIDPWHVLGVLEDLSDSVPVIIIEGSAHCGDMSSSSVLDSAEMKAARQEISKWIGKWVNA